MGMIGREWGKLLESGGATILVSRLLSFFVINIVQFLNKFPFQRVTHWLHVGYLWLLVGIPSNYYSVPPNCVTWLKYEIYNMKNKIYNI